MRDFTDDLKEISRRLDEARGYLKIDTQRERFRELEVEVSRPDLWDDQEVAKRLNAEYANVKGDLDQYDALSRELEDVQVLHELAREVDDAHRLVELLAVGDRIREHEAAFGIRVEHLDRVPVHRAHHVARLLRRRTNTVLGRSDQADDAVLGRDRAVPQRMEQSEDRPRAAHVVAHLVHLAGRLDAHGHVAHRVLDDGGFRSDG